MRRSGEAAASDMGRLLEPGPDLEFILAARRWWQEVPVAPGGFASLDPPHPGVPAGFFTATASFGHLPGTQSAPVGAGSGRGRTQARALASALSEACERWTAGGPASGCAAGPSASRAARAAVLELVERDAFMRTWVGRLRGRQLDLDQSEPVGWWRREGYEVKAYELPAAAARVVLCLGMGSRPPWPRVAVGLGTNDMVGEALAGALGELAQVTSSLLDEAAFPVPDAEDHSPLADRRRWATTGDPGALAFIRDGDVPEPAPLLETTSGFDAGGHVIEVEEITPASLHGSPFHVVRASCDTLYPYHHGTEPLLDHPRLREVLAGREPNHLPHPLA